jgi:hypothetical protein
MLNRLDMHPRLIQDGSDCRAAVKACVVAWAANPDSKRRPSPDGSTLQIGDHDRNRACVIPVREHFPDAKLRLSSRASRKQRTPSMMATGADRDSGIASRARFE